MQVIYSCLVITMFMAGTVFGFVIGKNGFVQINLPDATVERKPAKKTVERKPAKKTVEQQLEDMMNYDGKVRKGGE